MGSSKGSFIEKRSNLFPSLLKDLSDELGKKFVKVGPRSGINNLQ